MKMVAWILVAVAALAIVGCSELSSPHYSCWSDAKKEVVQEIEQAVDFPATLDLKDVAISLTNPPDDESLDHFGVEFESSNLYGVPVRGRAIITYRKDDCSVADIRVLPSAGFFKEADDST